MIEQAQSHQSGVDGDNPLRRTILEALELTLGVEVEDPNALFLPNVCAKKLGDLTRASTTV
jgi:hypothetical protein